MQQDQEEGQGVEAGKKKNVEQDINLNASNMCRQIWEKTWPIKVEFAWESTQRMSKHSGVFLQIF